ncbi:GFA family protein [Lichenihabitans psoromatis]|uniref:GFA family protein n=1 Tax=Lichenihabitans psoromatis TaxID=2528642 RepID=UPI001035989E|nr:GFA family protein [Lichenihabitans psoromatis]
MSVQTVPSLTTGSCLCGGVRFAIHGPLRPVTVCHCIMCQRANTHDGAYTACAPDALELRETRKLKWYRSSPSARRGFCSGCGAQLFWEPTARSHISISAGSLDRPNALVEGRHIFCEQKADYEPVAALHSAAVPACD